MNKQVKDSLDKLKAEVKKLDEDLKEAAKEGKATKALEASNANIKKHLEELEKKLKSDSAKLSARRKKSK